MEENLKHEGNDPEIEKEYDINRNEVPLEYYIGAAILGAIGATVSFYFYNQLSDESKESVKESAKSIAKKVLAKFFE